MDWRAIVNGFKFFTALTLVLLNLTGCGDMLRMPTEEEKAALNKEYAKPEELKVTVVPVPAKGERIFLIDVSGSMIHYLGSFGDEIVALSARDETTRVCIQQIASDSKSTATQRLCLPPVITEVCTHENIKPNNYFNTREETAYKEATARIEKEMVDCNARLETKRNGVRDRQDTQIVTFLRKLKTTRNTDIFGAFQAIKEMTQCVDGCQREVWIFSDMKDDPIKPRGDVLPVVDLSDATTSIRARVVTLNGEGYEDDRETMWSERFTTWGATSVEWKTFQVGEAAAAANTAGVVSNTLGRAGDEPAPSALRTERPEDTVKDVPQAPPTRTVAPPAADPPLKKAAPIQIGADGRPK